MVQILDQCPLQRQELWLQRLLRFDLTCNASLVASLPGRHVPKRALQPNQVALRLSWEENETETGSVEDGESPTSPTRDLVLKKMPDMDTLSDTCRWCVVKLFYRKSNGETNVEIFGSKIFKCLEMC